MRKKICVIAVILPLFFLAAWRNVGEDESLYNRLAILKTRNYVVGELKAVNIALGKMQVARRLEVLRKEYHIARRHYKHIEFFIEHISPKECKYSINGPLVNKHDPEIGNVSISPNGFQKIEELLFENDSFQPKNEIVNLSKDLLHQLEVIAEYYKTIDISDGMLLEMMQLQFFRLVSLNLNGYDATLTLTNVSETEHCLVGIKTCLGYFKPYSGINNSKYKFEQIIAKIEVALNFLKKNRDYNSFQRLTFITDHINPLNSLLVEFHNQTKLPWTTNKKALNLKSGFLFGEGSYNLRFFSIYYDDTIGLTKQASLGQMLFKDPILSANNSMACVNCHNPKKSFSDGLSKSLSIDGKSFTARNSPTLINAIFQKAFFYDGRSYQLEDQIHQVINNPIEMNGNFEDIIDKLRARPNYRVLFKEAFSGTADTSITTYAIQKSLTEYEKTLVSFNSRFDKYLAGDKHSLNASEINGYTVFAGKALCGSCHFFPLFNGNVPPFYSDTEFEVIGTPSSRDNISIDEDKGRYNVTGMQQHFSAFKTPSLRNIEYTAPYMHNGIYTKLEEVIEFYHKGGGVGFGFNIKNQTLPFDSLSLSQSEKNDLLKFMLSLSDSSVFYK